MLPYLIMSRSTLNKLMMIAGGDVVNCNDGTYEFNDCKILINEDLQFGDVDIR